MRRIMISAMGIAVAASVAGAEQPRIYAVPGHEKYCPAGLQPVTMDGVICCGTPNQHVSYAHMLAEAAHKPRHARPHDSCRAGTKGCSDG